MQLLCGLLALLSSGVRLPRQAVPETRLVILGTGTPNPDPERSGPALAVVTHGTAYLIDAGPGVVRRAAAAARNGIPSLSAARLGMVFLTHLHSDHTAGLPDLIHTGWVAERTLPLRVFGPPGTRNLARHLTLAYAADIENRRHGSQPHTEQGWKVEATELKAGVAYRDSNVTVTAIPVHHDGWKHAFGYRFETKDRVIVISGDATPSEALADACNGCDLLVHEVYSIKGFATRSPEWQRYHADAHTSTEQLAMLAGRARPKLLVLYHQLYWGATDDDLLAEIGQRYQGRVVSARDLVSY